MAGSTLPRWAQVLVVVAHPDDESFALGAVLDAFAHDGARVCVLCLTRGEASTLHGVPGDLDVLRTAELNDAAAALGVTRVWLRSYPDGALADVPLPALVHEVLDAASACGAEGVVAFDSSGVTGHRDHVRATEAAIAAADALDLPVLGWTLPAEVADVLNAETGAAFHGHPPDEVDVVLPVERTRQDAAVACHASQAVPGSVLWRRLELLAGREHLRWLRPATHRPPAAVGAPAEVPLDVPAPPRLERTP